LRVYQTIEEDLFSEKCGAQEGKPHGQTELDSWRFDRLGRVLTHG
jgi:hypothetical protein